MVKGPRNNRWYFPMMAPNTKGSNFAWLDPSPIYANADAFKDLLIDLCEPFDDDEFDLVAGLDAMGFILGSAIASNMGKGFIPIRKAGKLCVSTDQVSFTNYSRREQQMELRTPAFNSGARILIVDQWIETGGTMEGAIKLIKNQGGVVAGLVAIVIEDNLRTKNYLRMYKCVSAVLPNTEWQTQANNQFFESFKSYSSEAVF